ncbi:MAG: DnaD domain protein [Candidatus Izemoplasmataceae bacterium]
MKQLLKQLIDEKIVDYNMLVLKYYHHFDLSEKEAIALMKLNSLLQKKQEVIKPEKFQKWLSLDKKETEALLMSLMNKGYLKIKLIDHLGKSQETFDIDFFLTKIIDLFNKKHDETMLSITQEYVSFLEDALQTSLSPLDIEIITKWIDEDHYSLNLVKEATLKALKFKYPNVKKIDSLLLEITKEPNDQPEKKDVLKEFYSLWDE